MENVKHMHKEGVTVGYKDNQLSILDSKEVAEMLGKEHKQLLREIRTHIQVLTSEYISPVDFFKETSYLDNKGESRPCFLVTKMGCEMLGNKLQGAKGTIFTAKYVKRFNQMEQAQPKIPRTYKEALLQLVEAEEKKEILLLENKQKEQIIGELKPKADYTDIILKNKGLVTITQIAKDYGMSGQAFNKFLKEYKVQYKQGEQWLLYSKYHDKGYTSSETFPIIRSNGREDITMNTKWTQKGRLFLYELLKDNYVLPMIEREDF